MEKQIANYEVKELLFNGKHTVVYRAVDKVNKEKVVLKTLQKEYPEPTEVAQLRLEYDLLSQIHLDGVCKAKELTTAKNKPVLVLEDFGGEALATYLKEKEVTFVEGMKIAIALADTLIQLHGMKIVHKDINLTNILINPHSKEVKVIDFGISSRLDSERVGADNPNQMEGTLPYMSPEQTGRMNRSIDTRTDLYSLGISLYQIFTGQLPFQSLDPMEIVYFHIAGVVQAPQEINADLPETLSQIILKLCAKTAEERYQSAIGLKYDLERCLKSYEEEGMAATFPLAEKDLNNRFQIPEKLYGRKHEINQLLETFERVEQGKDTLFLIKGAAGIGKTALINEIHKPIASKNGYFISGKFDQFKVDMPFYAFTKAFEELVRYLAGESADKLRFIQKELADKLGLNIALMVEQVPALETILGKQDKTVDLNPSEAQSRFFYTIIQFIEVFAKAEHPLTIFIDDWQWTDDASIRLIQELVTKEIPHFMLIGAYRDNEVQAGHPVLLTLENIKKFKEIRELSLNALEESHINEMLADTLMTNLETSKELTAILYKNTAGNPFYIIELLKNIHNQGLIWFDNNQNKWTWDIDAIKALKISSNVVDFMIEQLQKLDIDCQKLLQTAASIGEQFDLKTLTRVVDKSAASVVALLEPAVNEEIIFPVDTSYKLIRENEDFGLSYRFMHDKIQQSAYQLTAAPEREKVHYVIGKIIKEALTPAKREEQIIDLVRHLNLGKSEITSEKETLELVEMNLLAGQKAESAIAYKAAKNYFKTGIELLHSNAWTDDYDLVYALHKGLAKNAYLSQDFELAEKTAETVLNKASSKLDKIQMISMRVRQYVTIGKMDEAIDLGLSGLAMLGYDIPKRPDDASVGATLGALHQQYIARTPDSILNGPVIENQEQQEAASLMIELGLSAYVLGNANLYTILSLEVFRMTLDKGICPESSSSCITMGAMLGNLFGDMESANKLGLLALEIVEKLNSVSYRCRAIATYGIVTGHYNMHWSEFETFYQKGLKAGYASGDQFMIACCAKYSSGWEPSDTLENMMTKQREYLKIIENTAYQDLIDAAKINLQVHKKLSGVSPDLGSLSDEEFDAQQCLANMLERNYYSGMGFINTRHAELLLANEEYERAWEVIQQNAPFEPALFSLIYLTYLCHTSFFTCAGYLSYVDNPPEEALKEKMATELEKMKKWAAHRPENFLHWQLMMEAELAALENDFKNASILYEKAIQTAGKNNWLYNEAYANELAAKFYHRNGVLTSARAYFKEAVYLYKRRGAWGKINVLKTHFPDMINTAKEQPFQDSGTLRTNSITSTTLGSTRTGSYQNFDILALVKSYQAISEEIEFEALMDKMMRITMMTAGAEKGKLILIENDRPIVQASAKGERIETMVNLPVAEATDLPVSIINYVSRMQQAVILDNAAEEGDFKKDNYIQKDAVKSVLCSPIVLLNKLYGIIYLENSLSVGAFTNDRLQMLELLSSQMAISINNAGVYENLEQIVAERTQQLEDLNHTKDRIFAILGHDLKKPAIAFRGIAKKVNYLLRKKDYDKINLIGEGIEKNAFALNKLIDNLLNWALTQKKAMAYQPENIVMADALEEVTSLFIQIAVNKQIELVASVEGDVQVWADRNALTTVIRNLVDNALKYSEANSQIKINCTTDNGKVRLSVSDAGTGIPADKIADLFELKKDKSVKGTAGEKGTGLGLHLVHELVKLNEGEIAVESTLGEGSTFTVSLPSKN